MSQLQCRAREGALRQLRRVRRLRAASARPDDLWQGRRRAGGRPVFRFVLLMTEVNKPFIFGRGDLLVSSASRVQPPGRATGRVLGGAHGGAGASLPLHAAAHVVPEGPPRFTDGKTGLSRFLASPASGRGGGGWDPGRLTPGWAPVEPGHRLSLKRRLSAPLWVSACCLGALGGCRAPPSPGGGQQGAVPLHLQWSAGRGLEWQGDRAEAQTVAGKQVLLTWCLVLVPTPGCPPLGPRAEPGTAEVGPWGRTAPDRCSEWFSRDHLGLAERRRPEVVQPALETAVVGRPATRPLLSPDFLRRSRGLPPGVHPQTSTPYLSSTPAAASLRPPTHRGPSASGTCALYSWPLPAGDPCTVTLWGHCVAWASCPVCLPGVHPQQWVWESPVQTSSG